MVYFRAFPESFSHSRCQWIMNSVFVWAGWDSSYLNHVLKKILGENPYQWLKPLWNISTSFAWGRWAPWNLWATLTPRDFARWVTRWSRAEVQRWSSHGLAMVDVCELIRTSHWSQDDTEACEHIYNIYIYIYIARGLYRNLCGILECVWCV